MNLTSANKAILYANFNQDYTCFSIGTRNGYQLFNCEPLGKMFNSSEGGIGIAEMLFSASSLVALVGGGDKPAFSRTLMRLINTKRGTLLNELKFPTFITAVRLNRKRMVILQERTFSVYDMTTMKLLQAFECALNKNGVCALSPNSEGCLFAFPGEKEGSIHVLDVINLTSTIELEAHQGVIQCLTFNYNGSLLATASDRGTLIRVFSMPSGEKLHQFRRGTYPATIYSLAFNQNSSLLAVSSDSDTIHIFKLANQPTTSYAWSFVDSFLPTSIQNMVDPARNFAYIKLPSMGEPCISGFVGSKVLVITAEGTVLIYNLDDLKGGQCTFVSGHSVSEI